MGIYPASLTSSGITVTLCNCGFLVAGRASTQKKYVNIVWESAPYLYMGKVPIACKAYFFGRSLDLALLNTTKLLHNELAVLYL